MMATLQTHGHVFIAVVSETHTYLMFQGPATSYVASGLEPARYYHFSVRVVNKYGPSVWSAVAFRTKGVIRKNADFASAADRKKFVDALLKLNAQGEYLVCGTS